MVRKLDWDNITESDLLILKENDTISITFKDNGAIDDIDVYDEKTESTKTVDKYVFKVIDKADGKEKEFSTLANRLMNKLKEFKPLKDKTLVINKFRFGKATFDIDYKVSQL